MDRMWACQCGHEWHCTAEEQAIGAVVECSECKSIWAQVRRKSGYPIWIPVDPKIAFHPYYSLLEEPTDEE